MFKKNKRHLQPRLLSAVSQLSEKHRQRLENSWASVFYREVFCRIDEEIFSVLYADLPSRPNVAVNVLVGFEILKAGVTKRDMMSLRTICRCATLWDIARWGREILTCARCTTFASV